LSGAAASVRRGREIAAPRWRRRDCIWVGAATRRPAPARPRRTAAAPVVTVRPSAGLAPNRRRTASTRCPPLATSRSLATADAGPCIDWAEATARARDRHGVRIAPRPPGGPVRSWRRRWVLVHPGDLGWRESEPVLLVAGAIQRIGRQVWLLAADGSEACCEMHVRAVDGDGSAQAIRMLEDAREPGRGAASVSLPYVGGRRGRARGGGRMVTGRAGRAARARPLRPERPRTARHAHDEWSRSATSTQTRPPDQARAGEPRRSQDPDDHRRPVRSGARERRGWGAARCDRAAPDRPVCAQRGRESGPMAAGLVLAPRTSRCAPPSKSRPRTSTRKDLNNRRLIPGWWFERAAFVLSSCCCSPVSLSAARGWRMLCARARASRSGRSHVHDAAWLFDGEPPASAAPVTRRVLDARRRRRPKLRGRLSPDEDSGGKAEGRDGSALGRMLLVCNVVAGAA
jgi:hypothetical protein